MLVAVIVAAVKPEMLIAGVSESLETARFDRLTWESLSAVFIGATTRSPWRRGSTAVEGQSRKAAYRSID